MTGARHPKTVHPLIVALRAERERQELSQANIARRSGWSNRTVAALERGENHPSANFLQDYGAALGLTLGFFRADGTVLPPGTDIDREFCAGCERSYQVHGNGRLRSHECKGKAGK